ncbi:MAG TPA: hypothetical protein VHP31_01945 [Caproicibacter sp.]|nr:hypothetical protein [Caproicibacter sp.]
MESKLLVFIFESGTSGSGNGGTLMSYLEKFRNKLVHLLFPFVERFLIVISVVLVVSILLTWSVPQKYWQIRSIIFWLIIIYNEIHSAGVMERDYLPIQPGNGPFYRIYRFIDVIFFLLLLVLLVSFLVPGPPWLNNSFYGVLIVAVILRTIGDQKYRPKNPEE